MDELRKIEECFRAFIEGSLISHDIDAVEDLFTDDIMAIGMGAQGIVRCKEDMRPILMNTRSDMDNTQTAIQYSNMQIRYYGGDYANICSTVTISMEMNGKLQKSHIGQCAGLRKIDGAWKLNMVQATPLSVDIQEIEAYPLSFAEDEIEKYRMQEQFSNALQKNMTATYKIDFELGIFEDYIPQQGYSFPVEKNGDYESELFKSASVMLEGETQLQFLRTFSIANLMKLFQSGQTDVALDYESIQPDGSRLWLQNSLHLFTDIKGHLKGYLYVLNIDREKRQALLLTQQAELDLMTSVYNKETARRKIELALQLCSTPMTCAFFMIDLDYFKQINDTYGHSEGDRVIEATAAILKGIFRKEDIIGRIGGDEFCVFYTGSNAMETLIKRAEQICIEIRNIHPSKSGAPGTSASIGIARRMGGENFSDLYKKADLALYARKAANGRDGYTFYEKINDSGKL